MAWCSLSGPLIYLLGPGVGLWVVVVYVAVTLATRVGDLPPLLHVLAFGTWCVTVVPWTIYVTGMGIT